MAYGRNYYPDQQVFIGELGAAATELKGVQSFDGSWSIPYEQMMAAGYDFVGTEVAGELVGDVSVSRSIITTGDPITGLLDVPVSGYLIYGKNESYNKVFNFNRGYVTSYSSSCSVGDVASADFSLTAYGSIGKTSSESRSYTEITAEPAIASNISLTSDFGSTNAIQSYSLSVDFTRAPIHRIGEMLAPTEFTTDLPIVGTIEFDVVVNDYEVNDVRDVICSGFTGNLIVDLNTCTGGNIRSFKLCDAKLLDSSITAGIGDDMSLSLTYECYYNSVSGAVVNLFGGGTCITTTTTTTTSTTSTSSTSTTSTSTTSTSSTSTSSTSTSSTTPDPCGAMIVCVELYVPIAAVNGEYTPDGLYNGKRRYDLGSQYKIRWRNSDTRWEIYDTVGATQITTSDSSDAECPYDATWSELNLTEGSC